MEDVHLSGKILSDSLASSFAANVVFAVLVLLSLLIAFGIDDGYNRDSHDNHDNHRHDDVDHDDVDDYDDDDGDGDDNDDDDDDDDDDDCCCC